MEDITVSKKDLVEVCEWIIDCWKEANTSDYGRHSYECTYCGANDEHGEIKHKLDCVLLIAQDLITRTDT